MTIGQFVGGQLHALNIHLKCAQPKHTAREIRIVKTARGENNPEFVVSVEEKVATEQTLSSSQRFYLDRNKQILARFREALPDKAPAQASPRNYMQVPTRYRGIHFEWMHRSRPSKLLVVAVHFETSSKERNRKLCEMLREHRSQIEDALQETVEFNLDLRGEWSAVYVEKAADPWSDALVQWAAGKMVALIKVAQPLLDESCGQSA